MRAEFPDDTTDGGNGGTNTPPTTPNFPAPTVQKDSSTKKFILAVLVIIAVAAWIHVTR